jgi:hypothetical protein
MAMSKKTTTAITCGSNLFIKEEFMVDMINIHGKIMAFCAE